jgi:hypothetical protein
MFFIQSDLMALDTNHEDGSTRMGHSFKVVAELPCGRRFNHFFSMTARGDVAPRRLQALLGRIQAAVPTLEGSDYWRETWPAYGSPAYEEIAADMAAIERAEDEADGRYERSGRGSF